jgi:hypothetical protein
MPMHDQLILECQSVAEVIPKVVQGVKATIGDPESTASQLNLINVTEEFIQVSTTTSTINNQFQKITQHFSVSFSFFFCFFYF